jgi:hypothetical protein
MGWMKERFGEASTHAGLALVATAINSYLTGGSNAAIMAAVQGLFGLVAIARSEGGSQ